jgi:general stress protein YciG
MANEQNPGSNSNRGFAAMDPQKQRQIASMGGKAAHAKGAAHEFTSAEAREAGRKGGLNSHGRKNANAANGGAAQMTQSTPQSSSATSQQPQSDNVVQQQA